MYALEFTRRLSQTILWGSLLAAMIVIVTG